MESGDTLQHYALTKARGFRAAGELWEALDQRTNELALIKIPTSTRGMARLRTSAKFVARLQSLRHPNLLSIREAPLREETPFIVFDAPRGIPLIERVRADGPMPPDVALDVLQQLAAALAVGHERRVFPAGLRPETVLIDHSNTIEVTDFGLAPHRIDVAEVDSAAHQALAIASSADAIDAPACVAALAWQAPEAWREPADVEQDVYALALIGVFALTGRTPGRTLGRTLDRLEGLPPGLKALLEMCLHEDPDERPESAVKVAAALNRIHPANPRKPRRRRKGSRPFARPKTTAPMRRDALYDHAERSKTRQHWAEPENENDTEALNAPNANRSPADEESDRITAMFQRPSERKATSGPHERARVPTPSTRSVPRPAVSRGADPVQPRVAFSDHAVDVFAATASDDGLVVSGDVDGVVFGWSAITGKRRWRAKLSAPVRTVAIGPDSVLVGTEDGEVHSLDRQLGLAGVKFSIDWPVTALTYDEFHNQVLCGQPDGAISAFSHESGAAQSGSEGDGLPILNLAVFGDFCYATDAAGRLRVWHVMPRPTLVASAKSSAVGERMYGLAVITDSHGLATRVVVGGDRGQLYAVPPYLDGMSKEEFALEPIGERLGLKIKALASPRGAGTVGVAGTLDAVIHVDPHSGAELERFGPVDAPSNVLVAPGNRRCFVAGGHAGALTAHWFE